MAHESRGDTIGYVKAIDGLRAVAVVSVMLFHLNARLLPGGFVGVDVFFVISGFVVTASLTEKRFRRFVDLLAYFYARRLVRIMPALIVMLLATILLYALFVPDAWLSQSIDQVARSAFWGMSNVRLMLDADSYFSPRAEFDPFTHTWSLGVEEQFYLVFPFLLYVQCRFGAGVVSRRWVIAAVGATSLVSLVICAWLTGYRPKFAFYSIPARFWELGVGMALCLTAASWKGWLQRAQNRIARILLLFSAGLIAVSFAIPASAGFPFPFAFLPVAGAAGVIAVVCAEQESIVHCFLSSRPLVVTGRMSYSLYLWHWPVFVLFRWTVGLDGWVAPLAALALAAAAGAASFRFVERPTRRSPTLARLPRWWVAAGGLAVVFVGYGGGTALLHAKPTISLSTTAQASLWYPNDNTPLPAQAGSCITVKTTERLQSGYVNIWRAPACPVQQPVRLFVIGDSHSLVYIPSYRRLVAERGAEVQLFFKDGCSFLALDRPMAANPECQAYRGEVVDRLIKVARPGDIVFLPSLRLNRYSDQWGGDQDAQPAGDGAGAARAAAVEEAHRLITRFRANRLRVLFEAPTPVFRSPAFRCSDWFNMHNPVCAPGLLVAREVFEAMRAPVLEAMRSLQASDAGIVIWDPSAALCSEVACHATSPSGPLFFDGDHLSGYANEVLYPGLSQSVQALLAS